MKIVLIPSASLIMINRLKGKTLYKLVGSCNYICADTDEIFPGAEIDWLISNGRLLKSVNYKTMNYEYKLSPYFQ